MRIFLLGFMGAGKSTAGKLLATKLNLKFIDLDEEIEKAEGKTVDAIFEMRGEEYFRNAEKEMLQKIVAENDVVIATGGGTPCFFDNMEMMNQNGITVFLQMSPGSLFVRLMKSKKERPLLKNLTDIALMEFIRTHALVRERFYKKAQFTVNAENLKGKNLNELAKNLEQKLTQ